MQRASAFAWIRKLSIVALLAFIGATFMSLPAFAADPGSSSVVPPGARRGTDVEVTFTGNRLADFSGLMLYYPGITVKEAKAINDNSIKATLAIAPDCRIGQHAFRLVTRSGMSNLNLFYVGAMQEIAEVEPNNEFDKPQPIELDCTINGTVVTEDIEYFVVEAKQGERITAEVEGIRLGRAFFDPHVAIFDAERFELDGSDDDSLLWHDAVASIIAPKAGKYIVALRESSFATAGQYRLHVGRFPRPKAAIPAGGKFGSKVEISWIGDKGGIVKETVTLPTERFRYSSIFPQDEMNMPLFAKNEHGISPSPIMFRLGDLDNVVEVEPNNELQQATEFAPPMGLSGVISEEGDVDQFKFQGKKGDVWEIAVHARSIGSPLDSVLTVRRGTNGAQIAQSDDNGRPDSYVRVNIPADDVYTISVADLLRQGGVSFAYRVEVKKVTPKLVLTLPERRQYIDTTNSVAQGNHMAFMVNLQRRDFGGDLTLELKNLPKGVTYETLPVTANMNSVPVIIKAAADAPIDHALVDLVAKPVDTKIPVEGHMTQETMLIRGNNNRLVFGHTADFMATQVAEKLPFRIEIIAPKAPLSRNGAMELKVRAIREGDFKAPIAIRLLYNPPGISSSGGVSIAEGQNEATIPLTANANAEMGSWPIVVVGESSLGNGQLLASSPFSKLNVVDAYFSVAFKPSAAEQGQEGNIAATFTNNVEFKGKAKVELVGLPAESTAEIADITKDTTDLAFVVKTTAKTPAGKHKTVIARVVIPFEGEEIVQMLGPGELRIDTPLPPKPNKPAATPAPKPAAVAAAKPAAPKPLSRLEMLRQDRGDGKAPANNEKK